MRKVTFGGAISLDNYLARPDDTVDWLMWCDEAAEVTSRFWKTIDTVVMGRRTWEFAVRSGQSGSYPGVQTYVLSRTLEPRSETGLKFVNDDAAAFLRNLKLQEGKDICVMGGGNLARSLFEADLIDEIGFNIHPVLLGAGIPCYYPMSRQIDLELIESQVFKNGCVLVLYRVKR